jgi:hypothetical protein
MSREIQQSEIEDTAPALHQEVEFALVLSRLIDSISEDPEHLRATIYELARHKLKEQFESESLADMQKLSKSLEIAIQGVEKFRSNKEGTAALPTPGPAKAPMLANASRQDAGPVLHTVSQGIEVQASISASSPALQRHPGTKAVWRFAGVCAIGLAVVFAVVTYDFFRKKENVAINRSEPTLNNAVTSPSPQSLSMATPPPLAAPSPALPSSFGIYAVSGGKPYQLDLLPGRAPDIRVAISPLITTDSRTMLPDGHLTFIVYRRDSVTNAADRAEVRVVARIARELSFDKDGKQVASKVDDNWVIRNISSPYRTAPKKDVPDMYEVQSENPGTPLAPGRYALVLKGYAYDFSIAGSVTDPRQCLERLVATNGQFYSECKLGSAGEPVSDPRGQNKIRDRK